ncbi:hypothetical protein HNY73_011549 [Argiope bruennichi]|uniref:Uncharacterized protein n=1 Tax=Argiope bruennichi TaxID=94029 RepID=A0A8T0F168_ARGBR|nr:hypothetical protein HNY73_011549 [Argiope bruennichi]
MYSSLCLCEQITLADSSNSSGKAASIFLGVAEIAQLGRGVRLKIKGPGSSSGSASVTVLGVRNSSDVESVRLKDPKGPWFDPGFRQGVKSPRYFHSGKAAFPISPRRAEIVQPVGRALGTEDQRVPSWFDPLRQA